MKIAAIPIDITSVVLNIPNLRIERPLVTGQVASIPRSGSVASAANVLIQTPSVLSNVGAKAIDIGVVVPQIPIVLAQVLPIVPDIAPVPIRFLRRKSSSARKRRSYHQSEPRKKFGVPHHRSPFEGFTALPSLGITRFAKCGLSM
jgi:hypothetical protein